MSVFSDNITNDLSNTEKIRVWFRDRVLEQFYCYSIEYKNIDEYIFQPNYHITSQFYRDFATLWAKQYKNELDSMGVFSTITDVKQKIYKNKFKVIVRFSQDPEESFYDVFESEWMSI